MILADIPQRGSTEYFLSNLEKTGSIFFLPVDTPTAQNFYH